MVTGLEKFRDYFKEYDDCYIIIGGSACDVIIEEGGFTPRATVDIDIILIIEALTPEFVKQFWNFIAIGKYGLKQKNTLKRNCYRFRNPETDGFPIQIELFSRIPDAIDLHVDSHLSPIPSGEGLSDLSAILLDDDYYFFTIEHSSFKDKVHYANTESIICLKAFAYLDNKKRKDEGVEIRTRDIVKHKNDIFRMVFLLNADDRYNLTDKLKDDLQLFADTVKNDLPHPEIFNINGFGRQNMQTIFERFLLIFNLKT
jgi:hypothetical protein